MAWVCNLSHAYCNHSEFFFFLKFLSSEYFPCVNAQEFFSALKILNQAQTKIFFLFFFPFWLVNRRREFELPLLSKLLVIAVDFVQILYNRKQRF